MACVCFLKGISKVANYITTLNTLAGVQGNRSRVNVATHPLMCPSSMTLLSDLVLFKSLNLKRVVLSSSGGSGRRHTRRNEDCGWMSRCSDIIVRCCLITCARCIDSAPPGSGHLALIGCFLFPLPQ